MKLKSKEPASYTLAIVLFVVIFISLLGVLYFNTQSSLEKTQTYTRTRVIKETHGPAASGAKAKKLAKEKKAAEKKKKMPAQLSFLD